MTDSETTLAQVIEILESREERFAWKTAKYLAGQLRKSGLAIDAEALDALLIEHARLPEAVLRYSAFPARKNLDTLWGHKDIVGELASLPNLTLDEEHAFFGPCRVAENALWCFLSHNHHDLDTVWAIRSRLLERGYGVWVFEAEIGIDAHIGDAVQQGLARSDLFVVYASRHALQSRWVIKEMLVGLQGDMRPYVVVDWKDRELCEFFASWLTTGWADVDIAAKTDLLLAGIPEPTEQVAVTDVVTLLQGMRDLCPEQERRLVIYAEEGEEDLAPLPFEHERLFDFDTAFPRLAQSQ